MPDAKSVFIADSCIGGLSVLKSLWRAGLASEAVFFADYPINPLGVKDEDTIAAVVEKWIRTASKHADTLVMACNTLSIRYQLLLQSGANLPSTGRIVSMVDCFKAMVRAETDDLANNRVLVIGTEYTASQNIYRDLLAASIANVRVETIAATQLERQIARIEPWDNASSAVLTDELKTALEACDFAVLACTCFPMVESELQVLFPDVTFLDPGKYCEEYLQGSDSDQEPTLQLYVSGDVVAPSKATEFARSYLADGKVLNCCN